MMSKIVLLLILLISNTSFGQSELWGLTSGYNQGGTIFKIDENGQNYEWMESFGAVNGRKPRHSNFIEASNGKLYSMTWKGGKYALGAIIEFDTVAGTPLSIFDFDGINGSLPWGSLIQANNGNLYGMTSSGGANNKGVIFEFDITTSNYNIVYSFDLAFGQTPYGSLIEANNGKLYGMTNSGGANNLGVMFEWNITGGTYSKLLDFDGANGRHPTGTPIQAANGKLYGMTYSGGADDGGVIFDFDIPTSIQTVLHDFPFINGNPEGSLIEASNGSLYGLARVGGLDSLGSIFEYNIGTDLYTTVHQFTGLEGQYPMGSLTEGNNGLLYGMTFTGGANDQGVIFDFDFNANSFNLLHSFNLSSGAYPLGSLFHANNNKLYGMTQAGGVIDGVIFEYNVSNSLYTKRYSFETTNGEIPYGSLIRANNGRLYGMNYFGGNNNRGVIFEYDLTINQINTLYHFDSITGSHPIGSLIQASNGKLYGLTTEGGNYNLGVLFEYDISTGLQTKLLDFNGLNGEYPVGSLIEAENGKLFGVTNKGGINNDGVIFEFDVLTNSQIKLHDFFEAGGANPSGSLIQAFNGKFYGLCQNGGGNDRGVLYEYNPSTGLFITKYVFTTSVSDGGFPNGTLLETENGELYGMTKSGGVHGIGTIFIFEILNNMHNTLHNFNGTDGAYPMGALIRSSNNKLYGLTSEGGINGGGIIFEFDTATETFVKTHDFRDNEEPHGSLFDIESIYAKVSEKPGSNWISVYPNPSNGEFTISLFSPMLIKVFSSEGKLVFESSNEKQTHELDIKVEPGVYFVETKNEDATAVRRFVIQ